MNDSLKVIELVLTLGVLSCLLCLVPSGMCEASSLGMKLLSGNFFLNSDLLSVQFHKNFN